MHTFSLKITDSTKPIHLNYFFTNAWSLKEKVMMEFNTTECNNLSLGRILSMKSVLDHHRPNSKKYLEHSIIIVGSNLARRILQVGLFLVRPERPVYVRVVQ
jgi:hypothetical protein